MDRPKTTDTFGEGDRTFEDYQELIENVLYEQYYTRAYNDFVEESFNNDEPRQKFHEWLFHQRDIWLDGLKQTHLHEQEKC